MPWELRKKPLLGEKPIPKVPKLLKRPMGRKVPKILRPPKPGPPPPGHEYFWRDE